MRSTHRGSFIGFLRHNGWCIAVHTAFILSLASAAYAAPPVTFLPSTQIPLDGTGTGTGSSIFSSATLFLGSSLNIFALNNCLGAADHPEAVVAADFDEDGITDRVIVNSSRHSSGAASRNAYFFKEADNGAFQAGSAFVADNADDIVAADFNRDSLLVIAAVGQNPQNSNAGNVAWVAYGRGDGSITLMFQIDLIAGGNKPLVAVDDIASAMQGNAATINVLRNDKDENGTLDASSTVTLMTMPRNGTATVRSNGAITYTPTLGFVGTVTFTV